MAISRIAVWRRLTVILAFCFFAIDGSAHGEPARHPVDIWSDGTRLAGDLWTPENATEAEPLPAILLSHGWGGVRSQLNQAYARDFAAAGFIVLTFDYRGWGDSDSRLVLVGDEPAPDADGLITVRARPIREVVDPVDQVRDILSALDYLAGEPRVDPDRIGLWGVSFSGGHVIRVAAIDDRVKAVVAQIGYMGVPKNDRSSLARRRAIEKARGLIDPIPQNLDCIPGLRGCPDLAKMYERRPLDAAGDITVPTLIIDVENEETFDRLKNGRAVYELLRDRVPTDYLLYPGKHFSIFATHRLATIEAAIAWFNDYMPPAS